MKTFFLYERPDGRVVLSADLEPKSNPLRTVSAKTWKEARASVSEGEFFHDFGHGHFITPRPTAYPREQERIKRLADDARQRVLLFEGAPTSRANIGGRHGLVI